MVVAGLSTLAKRQERTDSRARTDTYDIVYARTKATGTTGERDDRPPRQSAGDPDLRSRAKSVEGGGREAQGGGGGVQSTLSQYTVSPRNTERGIAGMRFAIGARIHLPSGTRRRTRLHAIRTWTRVARDVDEPRRAYFRRSTEPRRSPKWNEREN